MQRFYCGVGFICVWHFNECKTSRPTGFPVHNNVDRRDFTIRTKSLANIVFRRAKRQVANVNIRHLRTLTKQCHYLRSQIVNQHCLEGGKDHRGKAVFRPYQRLSEQIIWPLSSRVNGISARFFDFCHPTATKQPLLWSYFRMLGWQFLREGIDG
jgi:hypothetical protein